MSNDQTFKVKKGLQAKQITQNSAGTTTSGTLNLSTGNYFPLTLTSNTTIAFSNVGAVQGVQLEVTGGSLGYDISTTSYDSKSFDYSAQETAARGVEFKPDGTKLYICGDAGNDIGQYSLTTAWDISTASYESKSLSVGTQDTSPNGIRFKPDGTKVFMVGQGNDKVFQYSLTTAWDISTASFDSKEFSVSSQEGTPKDVEFKPDGTKMYVIGESSDAVHQYSLTTAWDVSTASYDSKSYGVNSEGSWEAIPVSFRFNDDGTNGFILGYITDDVRKYTLTTAYDLSTMSYDSVSFDVGNQETAPFGLCFGNNGNKMYVVGDVNSEMFQYTTENVYTLTWPSSIKWPHGSAPSGPSANYVSVYSLFTPDSGTTFYGVQTVGEAS